MKEQNFQDCIEIGSTKKQTPDQARANSLIATAKERISLITKINEKNCNFVFEDYYTSLLELLQAIAFKKGFNTGKSEHFKIVQFKSKKSMVGQIVPIKITKAYEWILEGKAVGRI